MTDVSEQFKHALLSLDQNASKQIAIEAGKSMAPIELVDSVIVPVLADIGEGWERGDIALSQVYMSGRICEELVDKLLPPGATQRKDQPPMAIAVLDDYHLLGKRIVFSVLRAGGYDLKDYGRVNADELIRNIQRDKIKIMLISTLMLNSALHIREAAARLRSVDPDIKIVVGGAPFIFDPLLWKEIKADAMGKSASEVIGIIEKITGA
jgi:methanogenic corrinoid protein MtbC1